MAAPSLIDVHATDGNGWTVSAIMRTVLDNGAPYEVAGVVGAHETYDGIEWACNCNGPAELARIDDHLRQAEEAGLSWLVVDDPEGALLGRAEIVCELDQGRGVVRGLGRTLDFAIGDEAATVMATRATSSYGYTQLWMHTPSWDGTLTIPVPGVHNAGAVLAAVAICEFVGVDLEDVFEFFFRVHVPGRCQLSFSPDQHVYLLVDERTDADTRDLLRKIAHDELDVASVMEPESDQDLIGCVALCCTRSWAFGRRSAIICQSVDTARTIDLFQAAVRTHFRWSLW